MVSTVMPTYARSNVVFDSGVGAWLTTADGDKFLDFNSGIAVNALGHSHPHLLKALDSQLKKFWHCSNLYTISSQELLAERLIQNSFAELAFFCNSGAEAVECAIKIARRHHQSGRKNNRYRIITATNAFHGRTLATIAAGGQRKSLDGFEPIVNGFDHVPFGDLDAVSEALNDETAAILIEPIQGEGGLNTASATYLQGLRSIASANGLLLIYDEVQSGMGRTGKLFAYQHSNLEPDIMCIAKALGGGFPVGACLATKVAAKSMGPGSHGSTFGGNPLAMAAANAVLDVILDEGFLDRVTALSKYFYNGLVSLVDNNQNVFDSIKGRGLMVGLKCKVENTKMVEKLMDLNLLTVVAGDNVVRLYPPLIVTESEIDLALGKIEAAAKCLDNARKK